MPGTAWLNFMPLENNNQLKRETAPRLWLRERGHDVDFRCEGAMHGAPIDDFDQAGTLIVGKVTGKLDRAFNAIELYRLRETALTVLRPDSRMCELHAHARQRPLFSSRIQCGRHRL